MVGCEGKKVFFSPNAAQRIARVARRRDVWLVVYRCPSCRRWHLTSRKSIRWRLSRGADA